MISRTIIIFSLVVLFSCTNKKDIDKLKFLKKGNQAYANNNLKEAIRFYDESLSKDTSFVDAWNNKGLALMKHTKYDEAIVCFDRAIQLKADYGEAIFNNARANLAVHQYYAALELLDELSTVWPDTSLLYFIGGLIYTEMGNMELAMHDFKKALISDSTNAEILVNIANLYYHSHQSDSAIMYIQNALKFEANQPHAYNILAMVYAYMEQYEAAAQAINTAISLDKHDAYFINNRGYILLKLNRLEEAEENVIQSMKMDPYNGWVYRNLGLLRYVQGNYTDATRLLEKALNIDNKIDHIYVDLATAYRDLGDITKACEIISVAPKEEGIDSLRMVLCK